MPSRSIFAAVVVLAVTATTASSSPAAECSTSKVAASIANEADALRTTDIDAAIAKYEAAIAIAPNAHRIVYKLALAYVRKEDWTAAARAAERATKLAPTFANYAATRGIALARAATKGHDTWEAARDALVASLALDDGDADVHLELGEALLHLDDEKGALVHFDRATRLAPDRSAGYVALADLYLRLGFTSHAERVLGEGVRLAPDDGKFALLMLLGQVGDRKHDGAAALARYEEAKRACGACSEGKAVVYFALGSAYATAVPTRKAEALANLATFSKLVCKGAAASRFAEECTQAYDLVTRLGGP